MFYAKGNVSQKLDVYLALLEKTITESNSSYRIFFIDAFKDAHELAIGNKSFFDLNNELYDVVNILLKDNSDYFKKLDVNNIDNNVFSDVKSIMGSLKQANTVVK
jgi:hypothetical protein